MTAPFRYSRVFALTVAATALVACGKKPAGPPQMPPAQVGVVTAKPTSVPLVRALVGRLSAYRSADVRARVSGVLLQRTYDEGTEVKQGQVLFQIDPAPLQATLNSSLAALAQARANYTNNHIAAQRARELAPKGYISKSDLDNAEAAERSSEAAVTAAQANVQSARINLGYATVRSPIDGRAGKQQVTEGALVGQGSATLLTTVDQIDPLYVNFTMGVDELDQLRRTQAGNSGHPSQSAHATLQLTLPDGSTYGQSGKLDFSGSTVDPSTGAVALRGTIPNPDHSLLPGMYAQVKARFGTLKDAFLVPEPALQRDTDGPYVLAVGKDSKIDMLRVITAGVIHNDWIVTQGVQAGDRIIVSGLAKAKPGEQAVIVDGAAKPGQASGKPQGRQPATAGH